MHTLICVTFSLPSGVKGWLWLLHGSSWTFLFTFFLHNLHLSGLTKEPTKWPLRPTKTHISMDIRPDWSDSSLCAHWVAKDPIFLHADSEDSDQPWHSPSLLWVFAGRTSFCWSCHEVAHFLFIVTTLLWSSGGQHKKNLTTTAVMSVYYMSCPVSVFTAFIRALKILFK